MKKFYIAIDIGATYTKFGLVDEKGKVRSRKSIPTSSYGDEYEFVGISRDIIMDFLNEGKIKLNEIHGIGIGAPGAIDSSKGIVHYFVNIRGWKEVPLKKMMEKKIGLPTYIDNDVNVMTLGEHVYGMGKGARNMIGVTLGTGVGGGLILEGKIYRGADLAGGEIGHMPINVEGPKCLCGGWGCMEDYVGNNYIVKRAIKDLEGKKSILRKMTNGKLSRLTPKIIHEAAVKGDRLAKKILKDTGMYLGVNLAGVINLLNPEVVVIGGGVANAGEYIFKSVRETVKRRAMPLPAKTAKIVKAKLGEDAALIGASVLVREKQNLL